MKGSTDSKSSVAVAMTVLNAVDYLPEAIDSILEQSYGDFEFSIVNDGSEDGTGELLDRYSERDNRINVIHQRKEGFQISINNAIRASTAPLIARMDGDDISHPQRLEKQVAFMRDNPDHVLVGTNVVVMDKDGSPLYETQLPEDDETIRHVLRVSLPFYHGSVMFRREEAERCGLYDIVPKIEDVLLCRKLGAFGKMSNLTESLYTFRLVPEGSNNMTPEISDRRHDLLFRLWQGHPLTDEDMEFLQGINSRLGQRDRNSQYYLRVGKGVLHHGQDRWGSRKAFLKAIGYRPLNGRTWFNLALSFLPMAWVRSWENSRQNRW